MARKHERTSARRSASQVLYSAAIRNVSAQELLASNLMDCLDAPLSDYALKLIDGVERHAEELDGIISDAAENWTLERMPIMDVAIIRIALYEMLHVDDVPISVSINEAVELAKRFGGEDDSPKFVNGMLGGVARQLETQARNGDDGAVAAASAPVAEEA